MSAPKANVLSTYGSQPGSRPVSTSAHDHALCIQAPTPRSLNHKPRSSTSALSQPLTQRGLAADATCRADSPDTPQSPNYSLSKVSPRFTSDAGSWSHTGAPNNVSGRDSLSAPETQELRRDSHQEKVFKSKLSSPTPESVRELTYDGSGIHSCHSADDTSWEGAEPDILDTPFDSSPDSTSAKPYTSFLGVPEEVGQASSPLLSGVISDAGDQQQKRQKRSLAREPSIYSDFNLEESLASLPAEHELQEDIMASRERTHKNGGNSRNFIPKEKLYQVVNTESVARELMKKLSQVHLPGQIKDYAKEICRETEIDRDGKKLIKSYRKIFALLVLVDAASSILLFLEENVSDLELPLTLVKIEGTRDFYRQGDQDKKPLKCFGHRLWSPFKLESFQEKQWWMLAPFFALDEDGAVNHYVLQDDHILPFIPLASSDEAENRDPHRTGGYGKVFMVRIHDEHHNFRSITHRDRGFAIKQQLYDEHRQAYKKEIAILKKFTEEKSHKHVVSLLASYEQFKKFNLVFYRAEGNLSELWQEIWKTPQFNLSNVLWMAEQCTGLADALARLHRRLSVPKRQKIPKDTQVITSTNTTNQTQKGNKRVNFEMSRTDSWGIDGIKERPPSPICTPDQLPRAGENHPRTMHRFLADKSAKETKYGRHGDINPFNILWYDDDHGDKDTLRGTLKITDFGQAELNTSKSRTNGQNVAMTLTYRPPECDLPPVVIRQTYDVWCLGCVFLEFVTWMLGGDQLLWAFIHARLTLEAFSQSTDRSDIFFQLVRHEDSQQLGAIIKPEVTNHIDALHEHPKCTEYFHDLLVMIKEDMLVVESSERESCAGIWHRLRDMHAKCRDNEDYAMATNPWCLRKVPAQYPTRYKETKEAARVVESNTLRPQLTVSAVRTILLVQ